MERFVYPPYSVYQGYANTFTPSHNVAPRPPSKQKQPSWKQSKSSGAPNPYRGVLSGPSSAPPVSSPDYIDTYKRAQLKALLSHVSPGLTPRLRKANTKEVGIQVNPRVDAAVQCSLGSRPLQAVRPQSPSGRLSRETPPLPGVYSPILGRRLFTLPEVVAEPKEQDEAPASQQPAEEPVAKKPLLERREEEEEAAAAAGEEEEEENSENRDEELRDGKGEVAQKGGNAEEDKKTTFQAGEVYFCYHLAAWIEAQILPTSGADVMYVPASLVGEKRKEKAKKHNIQQDWGSAKYLFLKEEVPEFKVARKPSLALN
ncbi:protein ZAR1-like isoform X3 [Elgaria multicarinata webbii]|uniref:protein ZAR1-like isoform X3 n=1 Tax=Elgaria multicarinata webbii TaxID=159646 RepID=UPI002FCD24D3